MERRTYLEMIADILELCKNPQAKTRIMNETGMSYKILQNHLSQLQSLQFLEVNHHIRTTYSTTEEGLYFLRKWKELKDYLKPQHDDVSLPLSFHGDSVISQIFRA